MRLNLVQKCIGKSHLKETGKMVYYTHNVWLKSVIPVAHEAHVLYLETEEKL